MVLNWMKGDYFAQLMMRDKRSHTALEMLVDDLHSDKERTINRFLCHSGSEDFLWGLVRLLGNENARSVYIPYVVTGMNFIWILFPYCICNIYKIKALKY